MAQGTAETLMKLEDLELLPATQIQLNTATTGEPPVWQALDRLATGQKATAVLLLLMLDSEVPLIIDQPEDDLDNRLITDGVGTGYTPGEAAAAVYRCYAQCQYPGTG